MANEATLKLADISEGSLRSVEVDGEDVVVANVGGQCFAVNGICPHEGAPLIDGKLENGKLVCPWHFTEFDVQSGEAVSGVSDEPLATYTVTIVGDEVRIGKP